MGVVDIAGDRSREWIAFEGFTGTSINGVTGGADVQDLPLPMLLAAIVALAALAVVRARALSRPHGGPARGAGERCSSTAWLRRRCALGVESRRGRRCATARTYAGHDWRERHLAAEDGPLFAVHREGAREAARRARARVHGRRRALFPRPRRLSPLSAQRLFRARIETRFRRARACDPAIISSSTSVAACSTIPAAQRLRWDGGEPVAAELLLTRAGRRALPDALTCRD